MAKSKRRRPGQARTDAGRSREEYWRKMLAEQGRSTPNIMEFCRSKSISANRYFWWKRELKLRDAKRRLKKGGRRKPIAKSVVRPALVPVVIKAQPASPQGQTFEVLLSNQRVVRVPRDFDAESLSRLVAALEQC